jgi:hypothetical protein
MGPQNRSGRGGGKKERYFCRKLNPIPGPSRLILAEIPRIPQNCKRFQYLKNVNFLVYSLV